MELKPPITKQYNYEALSHAVSVWWSIERSEPWVAKGYSSCAPGHKNAVSSRQWDSASSVLDDELERNTANIIGACIDRLEPVERALIAFGLCGQQSSWVDDMDPARAQMRYEGALLSLALSARRDGVDV